MAQATHCNAGISIGGLPPDLVAPDYEGRSLTGLSGSIRTLFGLPARYALPEGALPAGQYDCVILVTLDALGCEQVEAHRRGIAPLDRVISRGSLSSITSVLPSTTTAALTSLFTGMTPQEHGILGHTLFLREFAMAADVLRFHPAWLPGRGGLTKTGRGAREIFPLRTIFEDLADAGIATRALMRGDLIGTALSEIHLAGAERVPIHTAADLCVGLRRIVRETPRPLFVSAYWDAVDAIAHTYGPGTPEEAAELGSFFSVFETEFLEKLPPEARRGTLVLFTADHGQAAITDAESLHLNDYPALAADLLMAPMGDQRTSYLYPRNGAIEQVRAALAPFTDRFHLLDTAEALRLGLFGRGMSHPEATARLGDLVVLARGGATFTGPGKKSKPRTTLRGRHGGATTAEMRVPLLALPLG